MKQPDLTRYSQDSEGQWWYHFGKINPCRMKAKVVKCEWCEEEFVQSPLKRQDKKPVKHCSRSCGIRHALSKDPHFFLADKEHSNNWKGGRIIRRGYVWVWSPEDARRMRPETKKLYVLEHRLVMGKILSRYLLPTEQVHHKNGIRDDNRPENLELWSIKQPFGARINEQQHCPTCTCFNK